MKDKELQDERNRDLYKKYIAGLEQGLFPKAGDAADYLSRCPAPRFYIDARKAVLLIGMIESRISLISLNSASRRRAWDLYERYIAYRNAHPDTKRHKVRILEEIVDEPAPEFYITRGSARKILRREIMKRKRTWAQ